MEGTEVAFAGVARQAELVRAGEVSPQELVDLYLERIERLDPKLNAFRVVLADRARTEAEEAASRRAKGEEAPLLGVPIAVKDSVNVAGELTTHGTGCVDEPAREDSEMVKRLRGAGAIVIGKTNLPELAFALLTESPAWGITRNPWNPERTPGGSSGGSGAAVAAGLAAAATASDGAGSIRYPAAYNSLFGLKPQRGRVPLDPDVEHWHGLSVNGYLTRTVRDTGLLLDATAGGGLALDKPPPSDVSFAEAAGTPRGSFESPSRSRERALWRRRCWTTPAGPPSRTRPSSWARSATGSAGVTRAGARWATASRSCTCAAWRTTRAACPIPSASASQVGGIAKLGALIPDSLLRRARAAIPKHAKRINAIFDDADVLMLPVVGEPPVPVGKWGSHSGVWMLTGMTRRTGFGPPWNYVGNPAAAVPAGFTSDGLPLSVQLVGRPNDEATLLSLAAQLEAERPWAERRPVVQTNSM